jgi:hypothetical protein
MLEEVHPSRSGANFWEMVQMSSQHGQSRSNVHIDSSSIQGMVQKVERRSRKRMTSSSTCEPFKKISPLKKACVGSKRVSTWFCNVFEQSYHI